MINISQNLVLIFLFTFSIINCKKKHKEFKEETYIPKNRRTPLSDLIRPSDVSRELFCDVCQAFFTEALKNLRNLNKESDVTFYLNNRVCAQEKFKGYHFSTPEMEIGCEVLIGEYYDEVQQILIERNPQIDTNETLIRKFCYRKIKACNGVNLSRYKPIDYEVIGDEVYDLEPVEQTYRVTPKIIDDYDNISDIFNETNTNNNTEL